MRDRIQNAFAEIRADDALLATTAAYLRAEREKRGSKRSRSLPLRLVGAAAMLVLAVGILGYRGAYYSAAAYVSIDVNPSVELTLNPMDRVIDATAYNPDGEAILQGVKLRGKPYDEAVTALLAELELQGYLTQNALVTMTVQTASGAKEQALCSALLQSAGNQMGGGKSRAELEVFPVTQEVRETARGCHMSAAKYLAIQELMEVDETATLEEYGDSTIRQIRQRTRDCREGHQGGASSGNENHGGGSHQSVSPGQGSGLQQNESPDPNGSQGGDQGQGSGLQQSESPGPSGSQGSGRGQGSGLQQNESPGPSGSQGSGQSQGSGLQQNESPGPSGGQVGGQGHGHGHQGRDK